MTFDLCRIRDDPIGIQCASLTLNCHLLSGHKGAPNTDLDYQFVLTWRACWRPFLGTMLLRMTVHWLLRIPGEAQCSEPGGFLANLKCSFLLLTERRLLALLDGRKVFLCACSCNADHKMVLS